MLDVALFLAMIPEPCYGLEGQAQVEGEHVWVEYDDDVSEMTAQRVTNASDAGWEHYVDVFGWPEPPGPIAVKIDLFPDDAAGQCITEMCGDEHVPRCLVFRPAVSAGTADVTAVHEVGHAFQYGLMGNYLDSLESWAWWMEGTAEYMTHTLMPNQGTWFSIDEYIENPHWMLHHGFSEFVVGTRSTHMYGTAIVAFFMDEYYGGPTTVRETWDWGAAHSGTPIFFPDAINGIGIDFAEFWPHYLARLSVLDLEIGPNLDRIPSHTVISELPGSGAPPPDVRPEGLGVGIVRFGADLGAPDMDLLVEVTADAAVPWHGVLARVDGVEPGSSVIDYEVGEFIDGVATLRLEGFDGSNDAFLVVSPESMERTPFDYQLAAELVPSEVEGGSSSSGGEETTDIGTTTEVGSSSSGQPDETDTDGDAPAADGNSGCGCTAGSPGPAATAGLLLVLGLVTRRRPFAQ